MQLQLIQSGNARLIEVHAHELGSSEEDLCDGDENDKITISSVEIRSNEQ